MIRDRVVEEQLPGLAAMRWQSAWLPDVVSRPWERDASREAELGAERVTKRAEPLHVLLVEDDSTIAEMYRIQLEFDGHRVTIAPTGEAGLQLVASGRPDIVLLDLLLPDRSGLEVMAQLKESHHRVPPIVILSNYGEPAMIERGMALGAVEYLVKSRVTPESVSRSLAAWVQRGRQSGTPRPD
jgi:CheY-like chemotaxis protein